MQFTADSQATNKVSSGLSFRDEFARIGELMICDR